MKIFLIAGLATCLAAPAFAQGVQIDINPEKRKSYKEYVVKEKRQATKFAPGFSFSIGSTLPQEVEVYDLPEDKNYGYIIHESRPAYVDRRSRRVIEYID